jgi:hypothetical protein
MPVRCRARAKSVTAPARKIHTESMRASGAGQRFALGDPGEMPY